MRISILVLCISSLLTCASVSKAQSIEELMEQIDALHEIIRAMEARIEALEAVVLTSGVSEVSQRTEDNLDEVSEDQFDENDPDALPGTPRITLTVLIERIERTSMVTADDEREYEQLKRQRASAIASREDAVGRINRMMEDNNRSRNARGTDRSWTAPHSEAQLRAVRRVRDQADSEARRHKAAMDVIDRNRQTYHYTLYGTDEAGGLVVVECRTSATSRRVAGKRRGDTVIVEARNQGMEPGSTRERFVAFRVSDP